MSAELRQALADSRELVRQARLLEDRLVKLSEQLGVSEAGVSGSAAEQVQGVLCDLLARGQIGLAERFGSGVLVVGGGRHVGWIDSARTTVWLHPRATRDALAAASSAASGAFPSVETSAALASILERAGVLQRTRVTATGRRRTRPVRVGSDRRTRDVWEIPASWLLGGESR